MRRAQAQVAAQQAAAAAGRPGEAASRLFVLSRARLPAAAVGRLGVQPLNPPALSLPTCAAVGSSLLPPGSASLEAGPSTTGAVASLQLAASAGAGERRPAPLATFRGNSDPCRAAVQLRPACQIAFCITALRLVPACSQVLATLAACRRSSRGCAAPTGSAAWRPCASLWSYRVGGLVVCGSVGWMRQGGGLRGCTWERPGQASFPAPRPAGSPPSRNAAESLHEAKTHCLLALYLLDVPLPSSGERRSHCPLFACLPGCTPCLPLRLSGSCTCRLAIRGACKCLPNPLTLPARRGVPGRGAEAPLVATERPAGAPGVSGAQRGGRLLARRRRRRPAAAARARAGERRVRLDGPALHPWAPLARHRLRGRPAAPAHRQRRQPTAWAGAQRARQRGDAGTAVLRPSLCWRRRRLWQRGMVSGQPGWCWHQRQPLQQRQGCQPGWLGCRGCTAAAATARCRRWCRQHGRCTSTAAPIAI